MSTIFPDKEGSKNWTFDIVGILHSKDPKQNGFFDAIVLIHWKYFDETTPYNRGQRRLVHRARGRREPGRSAWPRRSTRSRPIPIMRPKRRPNRRPARTGQAAARHRPDRRLDHGRGVLHPAAADRQHDDAGGARTHLGTRRAQDDRFFQRERARHGAGRIGPAAAAWRRASAWAWPAYSRRRSARAVAA